MKHDFIRDNPQLIQALRQAQDEKTEALIEKAEANHYVASPKFEREMERMIKAQSKPYYKYINTRAKKAALALAAAFVLLIATVFSVSALREPVVRFIVEVYEKFSTIFFDKGEEEITKPAKLEIIFTPTWLPEGYTLNETKSKNSDSQICSIFVSPQNDMICFQQYTLASAGLIVNTEGVVVEEVMVGEYLGICYTNLGKQTIIWDNGQYGFLLEGSVDRDVLLEIAYSLKEK